MKMALYFLIILKALIYEKHNYLKIRTKKDTCQLYEILSGTAQLERTQILTGQLSMQIGCRRLLISQGIDKTPTTASSIAATAITTVIRIFNYSSKSWSTEINHHAVLHQNIVTP